MALAYAHWPVPEARLLQVAPGPGLAQYLPAFVRPCPVRPRHGFVDSRRCETVTEVRALWDETQKADPEGELLLMPHIKAVCSAILTHGVLVLGPGNDGATSGHGSLTLPIRDTVAFPALLLAAAGVTQSPYLEIVCDAYASETRLRPLAVQLRDGLPTTPDRDYIPAAIKVARVVEASGDLVAWETTVATFSPGTAVYHPGGSLASHYAVHCRLHEIPVLTTRRPSVGETLRPLAASKASFHPLTVLQALDATLCTPEESIEPNDALHLLLFALHNAAWLVQAPVGGVLLGMAIGYTIRLGLCAALGEARHARDSPQKQASRSAIYCATWHAPLHAKRDLPRVLALFDNPTLWAGGFGGRAWARCTRATVDLLNSALLFARVPNSKRLAAVMVRFNRTINMAHNNGWWFDKFGDKVMFDRAANGDPRFYLACVPLLWHALRSYTPRGLAKLTMRRWHVLKAISSPPVWPPDHVERAPTDPAPCPCVDCAGTGLNPSGSDTASFEATFVVTWGYPPVLAQADVKHSGGNTYLHVQVQVANQVDTKNYQIFNLVSDDVAAAWTVDHETVASLAGSGTLYAPLGIWTDDTQSVIFCPCVPAAVPLGLVKHPACAPSLTLAHPAQDAPAPDDDDNGEPALLLGVVKHNGDDDYDADPED